MKYQDCGPIDSDDEGVRNFSNCEKYLASISNYTNFQRRNIPDCHCYINFTLNEDLRSPWRFYYGIRNYYQNHRRYLSSWDVDQLRGRDFRSPAPECRPIIRLRDPNGTEDTELPVVPCGLIANSWFNGKNPIFCWEVLVLSTHPEKDTAKINHETSKQCSLESFLI